MAPMTTTKCNARVLQFRIQFSGYFLADFIEDKTSFYLISSLLNENFIQYEILFETTNLCNFLNAPTILINNYLNVAEYNKLYVIFPCPSRALNCRSTAIELYKSMLLPQRHLLCGYLNILSKFCQRITLEQRDLEFSRCFDLKHVKSSL